MTEIWITSLLPSSNPFFIVLAKSQQDWRNAEENQFLIICVLNGYSQAFASSNREHLNGIESIVYVEFAIFFALILLGGLFLVVLRGRWDQAMAKRIGASRKAADFCHIIFNL